ncbi:Neuromedin-B receptor, partial [Nibea albiflora]
PQGHRDNVTFVNCVPYPLSNQMHPKIHSVMIFLVYFLIPLAIISVYYYHIARTLIKSAHDMPGEVSEHTKRQMCVGVRGSVRPVLVPQPRPLHVPGSFHYHQMDLSLAHLVITLLARVLSFSSSCVNPFALYLLSESFRRHFNSPFSIMFGSMWRVEVDVLKLKSAAGVVEVPVPSARPATCTSTSHIRLTSIKKATPTAAINPPAANGSSSRQEVAL